MKKCNFKGADLLAYCYGELSQQKLKEIKKHLSICESCFSEVEGLKKALELVKEQKLKKVPEGILNNYTDQVYAKINKEEKEVLANSLREKGLELIENLGSIFSSKLVPVLVTACVVIFAFIFMQQGKVGPVSLINQEVALLEAIGQDTEEIFLEGDAEEIFQAIEDLDKTILAQTRVVGESKDVLDDLELIQEFGEEADIDSLIEELNMLGELDIG